MPGGLIQACAYGKQDGFLSSKHKQVTFFDAVYKRHTNFASEFLDLTFNGNLAFGSKINIKLPRSGDLIAKMCVSIKLKEFDINIGSSRTKFAWVKRLGHAILKEIEISIGGKVYDRQYGLWLDIWYELSGKKDHECSYNILIGNVDELTKYNKKVKPSYNLLIPLQFWFNRFYSSAVPILCFHQDYDMEIKICLEEFQKLIIVPERVLDNCNVNQNLIEDITLLTNYIYLDNFERCQFIKNKHQYLIEQLHLIGPTNSNQKTDKIRINFNRTIKELYWVTQNYCNGDKYLYYDNCFGEKSFAKASSKILYESISYDINKNTSLPYNSNWVKICPYEKKIVGDLYLFNKESESAYLNVDSLILSDGTNLIKKISAEVIISRKEVNITILKTLINIYDLSTPVNTINDTRDKTRVSDPIVYDYSNYGVLLDGQINPTDTGKIIFNDTIRVDEREGEYFNYIEPEKRHSCIPCVGVNVYSFSIFPEEFQPSGCANIRFSDTFLELKYRSIENYIGNEKRKNGKTTVFGGGYNIMRIAGGFSEML